MPRYYSNQAGNGLLFMTLGLAFGSPFLFYFGFFQYLTAPIYITAMTATAGGAGALAFSATTFGLGALIIYGAVGLGYLYVAAKDGYNSNKDLTDLLRSHVSSEGGLTATSFLKAFGALLWSPFLVLGAVSGKVAKAVVTAYKNFTSFGSDDHDFSFGVDEWEMDEMEEKHTRANQQPTFSSGKVHSSNTEEKFSFTDTIGTWELAEMEDRYARAGQQTAVSAGRVDQLESAVKPGKFFTPANGAQITQSEPEFNPGNTF